MSMKLNSFSIGSLAAFLIFLSSFANADEAKTTSTLSYMEKTPACPKGFRPIPSGLACVAEDFTATPVTNTPPEQDCPEGFKRPEGVNFCIARNLTLTTNNGVVLLREAQPAICPKGFSLIPSGDGCKADNITYEAIDPNSELVQPDSYVLGHVLARKQADQGLFPGVLGEMGFGTGPSKGTSDWNLLDQAGYHDYDCDSFFPQEWQWAFANNDVDVVQATYLDESEYLSGKKFYAGSHGHNTTYFGICVGGGLYPNWDCNRLDVDIEKRINGVWYHTNTIHLAGETQDLNGGEKYTFVSTIPGYYRVVLRDAVGCPANQRVGVGVAYKDLPIKLKQ